MRSPLNVIVTGSNRGIGKAICELILQKHSRPNAQPVKLFAASRKGEALGLNSDDVVYSKLDISQRDSIRNLANEMKHQGGVDVLINNAGVNLDAQYSPENANKTLDVNYRGTLEMCQTFIPLLSSSGRIVNMSSVASALAPYHESIRQQFRNPDLTLEELEHLAIEFEESVESKTEKEPGFGPPGRAYGFSKACINAFTRILAKENSGLTINACCPGWVNTDMGVLVSTKTAPPKTPADGAKVPYRLAFEDIDGATGTYWANSSVRSRESGQVQEW